MRYLSAAEILELHRRIVEQSGGATGLRDPAALESSLRQPFQTYEGVDLYESFIAKVAAMGNFLIRNHPFVDGNKRIGHAVIEVTLALNGLELTAGVDEQENTILRVADGSLSRDDLTGWVNRNTGRLTDTAMQAALVEIKDYPLVRARMTRSRAAHIRQLRVEQSQSWRVVAAECHQQWGDDASWHPSSNPLAGMELCEAAAEFFGEHFLQSPWN